MNGITENNLLLFALSCVSVMAAAAASNQLPILNTWLQLVEYPDQAFRASFIKIMQLNIIGVFLVDRLCVAIFAPRLFVEIMRATSMKDVWKVVKVVGGVAFLLYSMAQEQPHGY